MLWPLRAKDCYKMLKTIPLHDYWIFIKTDCFNK